MSYMKEQFMMLEEEAEVMCLSIMRTETELRGDLLQITADKLRNHTQYFTARCFDTAAEMYGKTQDCPF